MLCLSTKAGTLRQLQGMVTCSHVLPSAVLKRHEWDVSREAVLLSISSLNAKRLVVRSSAINEDSATQSMAGHYLSITGIPSDNTEQLRNAVNAVLASYGPGFADDEILVQPCLEDIKLCGVVFTADQDTLAPYYIINYDESGASDGVTSGKEISATTFIRYKNARTPFPDPRLETLMAACQELEALFGNEFLDIEFAFTQDKLPYIFQVRPLVTQRKDDLSDLDLSDPLLKIHKKIQKLAAPHPNLLGSRAIFGVMPDWNPAEIIGLRPKKLALSLYKELVTDAIWAYQRDNYGYRNLRSHPLLASFLGVPYIDVRVDFNSFVPASLNDNIAAKLVEYYLSRLQDMPSLHDKVEFEIVHSCYYLDLPARLDELLNYGFNGSEIKRIEFSLLELTNSIINAENGLYHRDLEKVEKLMGKHAAIMSSQLSLIDKIYWLIEECKRFGTLPFAGIARAGFIAVQFLRSFVSMGIITEEELGKFMGSLNTVARRLGIALGELAAGIGSREDFLSEFGHLRPGTYDILSPSYAACFDLYFSNLLKVSNTAPSEFSFDDQRLTLIDGALAENGLKISGAGLISFITKAIEGREYAKFIFTRTLNEILERVEELGQRYGITRDEMAHVDIREIVNLYSSLDHRDVPKMLQDNIALNRELYDYTKAIRLPSLIVEANDIYSFYLDSEDPNFITLKRITADISADPLEKEGLQGKIVFIPSADPGYDYLFTKDIAGLVTQFGGANSHMAIRCAELGIPAVIGAGEKNFQQWSRGSLIELDCANRQVRVIA